MGVEGHLLALAIYLEHYVLAPLVVGEGGGEFVGDACDLPVDVALLSHPVDIFWDEPVVSLNVELRCVEGGEPLREGETEHCAYRFGIEAVWF